MLTMWVGRKVRLRALRPDDVKHFARYADDSEVARLGEDIDYPYNPDLDRRDIEKQLEYERDFEEEEMLL
jgi:hypothetical protein